MHRGVRQLLRWAQEASDAEDASFRPPASSAAVSEVEQLLGSPLPLDLRSVLARFDGATLPSGVLLSAERSSEVGESTDLMSAVREQAARVGRDVTDPEVLLPFHRSDDGAYSCFDRSGGPVADTWPIVDYFIESGELRLVHRTFDGWCDLAVRQWTASDFGAPFSLEKYLAQGLRHIEVEPNVSAAHATVAHARKRAGEPELALAGYLRAGRCVPPLPWCDYEALKLAVLLRRPIDAFEAAQRLSSRAPPARWAAREATPVDVLDVLVRLSEWMSIRSSAWVRVIDLLVEQSTDAAHAAAVRTAVLTGALLPDAQRVSAAPPIEGCSVDEAFEIVRGAYVAGIARDEDLLLHRPYVELGRRRDLAALLRLRRDF